MNQDVFTCYRGRAVIAGCNLGDAHSLADCECIDAVSDIPTGSHMALEVTGVGRVVYANTTMRREW